MSHPTHRLVAACTLALVLVACGDEAVTSATGVRPDTRAAGLAAPAPASEPSGDGGVEAATTGSLAPAAGSDSEGAPTRAPAVPDTVEVTRPDVVVRSGPMSPTAALSVLDLDGIDAVSALSGFQADLRGSEGSRIVDVVAVDGDTFRPLTPEVTAQTAAVWQRLAEGDVLVRHDVAHDLGLELGGEVVLAGPSGTRTVRIGAFASNGAPPLADIVVPWGLGADLGAPGVNTLLVAADDGADPEALGARVAAAVGAGDVEVLAAPVEREARVVATGSLRLEPFSYTDLGDGMIVIDPAWVREWIVVVDLPRVGRTRVHRLMAPQLLAALGQLEQEGLLDHLRPDQFGGAWVPRHIDWNPAKPLSMHAWGLAVDFNTHDNWLGETPTMHPRVVEVFESWGFEWGGRWSRPDGMHFQLDRIVETR